MDNEAVEETFNGGYMLGKGLALYIISVFAQAPFPGAEEGLVSVTVVPFATIETCTAARKIVESAPSEAKVRRVTCCASGKCDDMQEAP